MQTQSPVEYRTLGYLLLVLSIGLIGLAGVAYTVVEDAAVTAILLLMSLVFWVSGSTRITLSSEEDNDGQN